MCAKCTKNQPLKQIPGILAIALVLVLSSCTLPQVSAEERLFLNLSLEFVGAYPLPETEFMGTPIGGLSALAYDRQRDRIYALSDDRSERSPARFYTLNLALDSASDQPAIQAITVEAVTPLTNEAGEPYPASAIDPEGIALSPRQSVFIASEGIATQGIAPLIGEFDLETGQLQQSLPLPDRYLPETVDEQPSGVQDNLGFEALTLNPGGYSPTWLEPFRLFAATEAPLQQDKNEAESDQPLPPPVRFLHYLVGDAQTTLISEHLYPLDPLVTGMFFNGLTELMVLDQGGHFLSLERSFGLPGFGARIYQLATGGATDTSGIQSLKGDRTGITPIRKQLLLDLSELEISLDNLEGMTLGPRLPDGSASLLLVSDDNFSDAQTTQFLLFRLRGLQ